MKERTRERKALSASPILGIILFALTGCATNPTIEYKINKCDESRKLDLKPGDTVNLTDVGGSIDLKITSEGTIWVPGVSDRITNPNAVDYIIGDPNKPYYIVRSTQEDDDVIVEKVCPIKPTPTPQTSPTPVSHLGKGTGKLASLPRGFNPDLRNSKPVLNERHR